WVCLCTPLLFSSSARRALPPARPSSSCARCTAATATGSWPSFRSAATGRSSRPLSSQTRHDAHGRLVLRRPHCPPCTTRSRGHRRARVHGGAAHLLGERPRVLPRDDGGDRRGFA